MITVGNSVMGLYNLIHLCYHRYMTNDEHLSLEEMDQLVVRSQELAHLYVRSFTENPGADVGTKAQRDDLDEMLKALAGFVLASDLAVRSVACYVSGVYSVTEGDF